MPTSAARSRYVYEICAQYVFGAQLTVTASKVHRNTSVFEGGGIVNALGSTGVVRKSLVFKNTASDGGGIHNDNISVLGLPGTIVFLSSPNNCVGVVAAGCLAF